MNKSKTKVEEDGAAAPEGGGPGPGAATVDNVVGNDADYVYLGRDARKRELTEEEQEMLDLAAGTTKVISYDDFRSKVINKKFANPASVKTAIDTHLGDFGKEAHNLISTLPVINGLLEIKSINEALSSTYKEGQIRLIIDAVRNQ